MRFHVVALPHTRVSQEFSSCAYTMKVLNFCRMMRERGHTVYLYATCPSPDDYNISCATDATRERWLESYEHYTHFKFDAASEPWHIFNDRAIDAIRKRIEPRDFICLIGGHAQKPIADAFPSHITVEYGVGYEGIFSQFHVFESYAWMHAHYGVKANGQYFDDVIPGYLDPSQFPYRYAKQDYLLYVGRMIDRKGIHTACDIARASGRRLILAGPGTPPPLDDGWEYVGEVGPEQRNRLMSNATALLVPTNYIEPFGNVAIEAMACGTPVISTDWGAMTETVLQGVTGFRCRSLQEFVTAVKLAPTLDPKRIRQHVENNYSLDVIAKRYENYFNRLSTLWGDGWYNLTQE